MRVYNMTSRNGNKIANQFVIENGSTTVFQSYDSMIATIDRATQTILVGADWDYSTTTGKYRNIFMEDEGFYGMADKKGFAKALKEGEYNGYTVKMV